MSLTDAEKARVNRICKALLTDRRVWSKKFKKWLNLPKEERSVTPDVIWRNFDRLQPFQEELLCIMQKVIPEFDVQHIPSMIDLYSAEHNLRWDGEPLKEGEEIWIGIPNSNKRVEIPNG